MCSCISRLRQEDPVGTAGSYDAYVVVEMPAPWGRNLWKEPGTASPNLLAALERAKERGVAVRPLAVMPDAEYSRPERRRIFFYRRPGGPFAAYEKIEYTVPPDSIGSLVDAYLNRPDDLGVFEPFQEHGLVRRDILVCTHGTMDACCATFGYPVYKQVREDYARSSRGRLRAWRCSHVGGHRFAPTLVDLPRGCAWAHVDDAALEALVCRSGPVAALRQFYRGWTGLASGFEQAAEREIWLREGWDWTGYRTAGQLLPLAGELPSGVGRGSNGLHPRQVRIQYESPDGQIAGLYEATVVPSNGIKTKLACNADELEETRCYTVSRLLRLTAGGHQQPRIASATAPVLGGTGA